MPSAVKKRKAARKKKEKEAKINSSGDGDFKSQNGRNSESREVNAIYDHPDCHNSLDGDKEKLEKNDVSSVLSTVDEDESMGVERIQGNKETIYEVGLDGNGVVEVENELISAKTNAGQSIGMECIGSGKNFDERDDENSSSSSAEDCSIIDKKTEAYTSSYNTNFCDDKPDKSSFAVIGISESTPVGENINSLVESTLVADSVKSEVPVSTKKVCLLEVAAAENSVVSDTVTSGLKEDADTLLNQRDGTEASSFTNLDSLPKENEDKVLAVSMESNQISSSMMEKGSKYLEDKMFPSSVAPPLGASKDDAVAMEFEIPICFKNQTSASVPTVAQRTSLFSCCGLFDLLKGSN